MPKPITVVKERVYFSDWSGLGHMSILVAGSKDYSIRGNFPLENQGANARMR